MSKDLQIILVICRIIYKENKIKKTRKNLQIKTIKMKNRKKRVFLRLLLKTIQIIQSKVKQHLLQKIKGRYTSPCIIKTSFKSFMNLKKICLCKTNLIGRRKINQKMTFYSIQVIEHKMMRNLVMIMKIKIGQIKSKIITNNIIMLPKNKLNMPKNNLKKKLKRKEFKI